MKSTNRLRAVIAVCVLVGGILAALAVIRQRSHSSILYVTAISDLGHSIAMLDPEAPPCSQPRFIDGSLTDVSRVRWAPGRDQIIYVLGSSERGMISLWVMNRDGSGRKRMTASLPAEYDDAFIQLSVDQRYVALLRQYDEKDPNQWETDILDTQTATSQVMTATWFFEWSPMENLLAIYRWGDGDLYIVQPDAKILNKYQIRPPNSRELLWSPDGQQILFSSPGLSVSGVSLVTEIYSLDLRTGRIRPLTTTKSQYYDRLLGLVSISPGAKHIAFVSDYTKPDGTGEINVLYMLDVDSGREIRLADHVAWSAPVWSPDGKQIAFVSTKDGSNYGQIYTIDVASKQIKQLTCDDDLKQSLSW